MSLHFGVRSTMSNSEITNTPATVNTPERQVIAIKGPVHHWIEPWYLAYAILGALASGLAAILIPLVVTNSGGSSTQLGAAIAALNVGALFAPIWGWAADRSLAYRAIFLSGFLLIAAGFLGFTVMHGFGAWLISAYLVGLGTGASNTVASLFVVEFTPESEWSQRISWLQTFNALGAVLGMAIAGLLQPAFGTFVAALLVTAILVGGWGLPVPRSAFTSHVFASMRGIWLIWHAAVVRMQWPSSATFIAFVCPICQD